MNFYFKAEEVSNVEQSQFLLYVHIEISFELDSIGYAYRFLFSRFHFCNVKITCIIRKLLYQLFSHIILHLQSYSLIR